MQTTDSELKFIMEIRVKRSLLNLGFQDYFGNIFLVQEQFQEFVTWEFQVGTAALISVLQNEKYGKTCRKTLVFIEQPVLNTHFFSN